MSSDGCSGAMVYEPAHIGSETFDRSRSSKYTPSVSLSLDSSLREGAGIGGVPFIGVLAKIRGCGRFSSPLRNSECFGFYHSTGYTPSVSPSGCQLPQGGSQEGTIPFNRVLAKILRCGRFSSPLRGLNRRKKAPPIGETFVLCWHYLSSRQVTLQVLSAQMSLTAVFGMGTGGPSSQSIPTMSDEVLPHPLLCQSPRSALTTSFHFSLTARSW